MAKKCASCGAINDDNARFCSQCGHPLEVAEKTKTATKGVDPYWILGLAFVFALVVVLLIWQSNRQTLVQKMAQTQSQAQPASGQEQPSMEMMQHIQKLKDALADKPNDFDLIVQLGNSYFDIHRFDRAIRYYRKALTINSRVPEVLIDLGVAYFNQQQGDSAVYFMNKALQVNPVHLQGLYNLGIVYYNLGQPQKAVETWQKIIKHHPQAPEAKTVAGFIEQVQQEQNRQ